MPDSSSSLPRPRSVGRRPQGAALRAVLLAAGAVVLAALAAPVLGWGDETHESVAGEAVLRLPQPLAGLFTGDALQRLKNAAIAPDARRERLKKAASPEYEEENVRHFFDLDAVTTEPYPFARFPRDRQAAEKEFGAAAFEKHGQAPWAAADALDALAKAFKGGPADDLFRAAGDLAHYAADLHVPLHVTKNYNGQLTGNKGIHLMLEIGLVKRYPDFYAAEIAKDRREPVYVADPPEKLFEWLVQAYARAAPILAADTAARKATGYQPPEDRDAFSKELHNVASEESRPYYAALKKELEARGSPEAAAMRDAAAHVADLFYTAWVNADKPAGLAAAPAAPAAPEERSGSYWAVLLVGMAAILLLFRPRRA
jgi:hypothetical protein